MGKLQDLFTERDIAYSKYGELILQHLETNVIPAILEILQLTEQELPRLQWVGARIVENHVLVFGNITYQMGDVIKDNVSSVTLTDEMALMLSKALKIAVPLDLAEDASTKQITSYLTESEKKLRAEYEAAYSHDQEALTEAVKQAKRSQLGWDIDSDLLDEVLETVQDFEIESLSDEQQEALMLTHLGQHSRGKVN
ncbi:hypothetical protein LCGC14_3033680 [marine sediment metagenome]|uniref:Uncharacterized protein n=1 Tax=marine sediment metagenome TaxID=412755 RepID=A0A0F8YZJ2_9ZZZZ